MKAAIYCRLSEEDRDKRTGEDSVSIQNQKTMLTDYAISQDWEIYGIYSDDDYAGADRNRPEFKRLIEDARRRKFDIVLCKTQSRFTRELEIVEKYIHGLFPLWGIRFVSIVDGADTDIGGNKKSRQINGLINEWYLEDMSENIKSVLTAKRKRGEHIGAFALYGYMKDPNEKGGLIIDKEAADVVREIFRMFCEGVGKTAIAETLNSRGIPNPTEYKRLNGLNYRQCKNSGRWTYSAVTNMLKNEMYIGNMVQGRCASASYKTKANRAQPKESWYIVQNTHEPIIDMELWNRTQAMLEKNSRPYAGGEIGPFAGKAYCMYCGSHMRSAKSHGRHYLKCPLKSSGSCVGAFVSCEALLCTVKNEISGLTDMDEVKGYLIDNEKKRYERKLKAAENTIEACERALKAAYMDMARGKITAEDLGLLTASILEDKKRAEETVRGTAIKADQMEFTPDRLFVDIFIDKIEAGRKNSEGEVPVRIYWNF